MSARAWIAIAAASFGWGTAGVATRAALEEGVAPYAIATLRSVMAGIAIGVYLVWRRNRRRPSRQAWSVGMAMGVTNLAVPFILFTLAYQYASAGFVGLLAALIPLGTAIWAHFLLDDEPFHGRTFAAMTIALSGVALLVLIGDSGIGDEGQPVTAFLLGLVAVVSAAFGGVWAKRHRALYQPIELVGMQFATGGVLLVAAMLIVEGVPSGI
ncbi:MAG: DMT family transporter, partial [Acidimicrobiia bacterium]|nr:DMT family transporter [Acidimicrobiia bacterium]